MDAKGVRSLGAGFISGYELPNIDPMQEQYVLLTSEPS